MSADSDTLRDSRKFLAEHPDATTPRKFVLAWLANNHGADACNNVFHQAFHERFGGKRKQYLWGAMPVYKAMRLLQAMHREGAIERCRVSLDFAEVAGMPRWVYVYRQKSSMVPR